MKIVHVSIYPPKGQKYTSTQSGVANYTKNLVEGLQNEGVGQNIVLCEFFENTPNDYVENGVQVLRVFDTNYKYIFQIFSQIKKIKPDLVHIQQEKSLYGGLFTAFELQFLILMIKSLGIKVVTTIHGLVGKSEINKEFLNQNGAKNMPAWLGKIGFSAIFQPLIWYSDHVVVHNEKLKNTILKEYYGKEEKTSVIEHGIEDLQGYERNDARNILKIEKDRDAVLFMGFVNGYKGLDLLIEGFEKYAKMNPKSLLLMCAGASPNLKNDADYMKNTYERLQKKAEKSIPKENYEWIGILTEEQIKQYYSATDVVIFPYTHQIAASGPMAIALGYKKPYLVSEKLASEAIDKDDIFNLNPQDLANNLDNFFKKQQTDSDKFMQKRNSLLWASLAKNNYQNLYSKLNEK